MKKLLCLLVVIVVLCAACGVATAAQSAAASATAAPAVTAPPMPGPLGSTRSAVRPVPSILPTLRLIDSGMLPTLGFLLNLTDDQKKKAQDLLAKSDEELKPKIAAQIRAATAYVALLGKPASPQADLVAAAQKVLAADGEVMASRIKAFVAFRGILTPEQNTRLAQELQTTASRWLPQPAPAPSK